METRNRTVQKIDRKTNPKNADSNLFKLLTRLFSGPIATYRKQQQARYRRKQLDQYSSYFQSASGKQFQKSSYNPYDSLNSQHMANHNRSERYADFTQMEYTPEIASALDIYADEMCTSNQLQPVLKIDCPNDEIKVVLHELYYNILNTPEHLHSWCRNMCKYGDYFLYVEIEEGTGVKHCLGLPTKEVERLEGLDPTNPNYVQYQWNSGGMTFENWQVAHFRILGDDKYSPYGMSVLEPARRIWRQLTLLEDAMMSYRIVRAPERRVFYIDVGNIAPQDIEQYMLKVQNQMKKNMIVDPDTGRVDLRYNAMSVDEDFYIPVRGDSTGTRIDTLSGGTMNNDIEDVKYLRDKLFSALKVPQSYLSRGEQGTEDKATLAQKDIRFARTIQRLQRSIINELTKIGVIHLFTIGYRGEDLINFRLELNNPSQIAEMQHLEQLRGKFDIASGATEGYFSRRWIAKNIFGMSDEEFLRNQREMFSDAKFSAQIEAIAAAAEGGEGGLGGDLGGGDLGGDLGGEDLGMGAEGAAAEGDDSSLLAAPAKKEPTIMTPARAKELANTHHKKPAHHAKGHSTSGPRKRSAAASTSIGNVDYGFGEIQSLAGMIKEGSASKNNDNLEEGQLLKDNREIKKLIEELNTRYNQESDKDEE